MNLSPPTVQPVKNTIALQPQIELSEAEPPHKLLYVPEAIKAAAVLYLPSSGCAAMARQRRAARAASVGQSVSEVGAAASRPAAHWACAAGEASRTPRGGREDGAREVSDV